LSKEGESFFKQTKRYFGKAAFMACWNAHVLPLKRLMAALKDDTIIYQTENESFRQHISSLEERLACYSKENSELREEMAEWAKSAKLENSKTEYLAKQYDPARFVYESYCYRSKNKEEAEAEYEKMKAEPAQGPDAYLSLTKIVTLRRVEAVRK